MLNVTLFSFFCEQARPSQTDSSLLLASLVTDRKLCKDCQQSQCGIPTKAVCRAELWLGISKSNRDFSNERGKEGSLSFSYIAQQTSMQKIA